MTGKESAKVIGASGQSGQTWCEDNRQMSLTVYKF
jgi:hypothetical protein